MIAKTNWTAQGMGETIEATNGDAMYTLILSIIGLASYAGHAVTSIDGFRSMDECLSAGNAWIANARLSGSQTAALRALCVKKGMQ